MQNPEVWTFKEPQSTFLFKEFHRSSDLPLKDFSGFYFTHLVSVVVPDLLKVPQNLSNALVNDCEYYKILDLNLSDLLNTTFLSNFISQGNLTLLSIGTRIDCDNCVAVTPSGLLILSLKKDTYQSLGLEGKVSHFTKNNKDRYSKILNIFHVTSRERVSNYSHLKGRISLLKPRKAQTMPKFKDVPTLKSLSLKSIGSLIVHMTPTIMAKVQVHRDPQKMIASLQKSIDRLNDLLVSYVPYYLYETMAVEVLKAVKALIEKTKKNYYPHISMSHFLMEMNVVVSLTEVVLNNRLKSIDFSQWPKIMRYVLYKNLEKMSGLENLNLGSCTGGWRTSEHDKNILDGIKIMKNLTSVCLCFDCSDLVIQTISENCPNIQSIDVTSSRSVTDRSIPHLLNCKSLKELQLHRTSVSITGLAKLISGLPRLQDIGRCDEFRHIVKYIYQNQSACGPFGLRKIQTRDLTTENLRLLVDMFPKVEYVSLFHDMQVADLTILVSLDHLKELKLLSCAFYSDYLKQLLEVRGLNLTSLHLEHAEEMDFNVLVHIGQFCPKVKSLVFYNCDYTFGMNHPSVHVLRSHPFQNLERIFWVVDSAISHLEFILAHAVNIKYIHLGSSTGITHLSIVNILRANPMKHLEEFRVLYSSDMNMRTVELLMASCTNLKVLSELESWQGISLEELKTFKAHIVTSNFDLDIRPTLSFSS